jgi:thiamine-phosphate pyrophosphorylase
VRGGFPPGLLLITDRGQSRRPLAEVAAAVLDAGFAALMLREKDLDARPLLELAVPLAALCAERGRPFLVNDRLDVALALDGAGAHVGRGGVPVAAARRLLGDRRPLGYSAHAVDEAREALSAGADYVVLGPVFPSTSKPGYRERGATWLAEAAAALPAGHVVGLGGIETPERVRGVREAGAAGAAVMGAVMRSEDPRALAGAMAAAWTGNAARPEAR